MVATVGKRLVLPSRLLTPLVDLFKEGVEFVGSLSAAEYQAFALVLVSFFQSLLRQLLWQQTEPHQDLRLDPQDPLRSTL